MAGRRLQKARRRGKTACTPRPVPFRKWMWYDWTAAVIAILFLLYAIAALIVMAVMLSRLNSGHATPSNLRSKDKDKVYVAGGNETRKQDRSIDEDIELATDIRPGKSLCVYQIVAESILICVMILTLVWLKYLRNLCIFLIVVIFLVVAICIFIGVAISAISKKQTEDGFLDLVYTHVTKHLVSNDIYYQFKLYDLQVTHKCCGIYNYTDWKQWSIVLSTLANNSLPNSCCSDSQLGQQATTNPCNNDNLLVRSPHSKAYNGINKQGCGHRLKNTSNDIFGIFIIHGFVLAGLLILFLIFLLFLGNILYQKLMHPNWDRDDNPREQEDDLESEILPGTPAKSMMSDDENTFYAP